MHITQVRPRLAELMARAQAAKRKVQNGEVCDLTGFDIEVAQACAAAAALPLEEAHGVLNEMSELISCLEAISDGLHQLRQGSGT
jgi:hypothetical protein